MSVNEPAYVPLSASRRRILAISENPLEVDTLAPVAEFLERQSDGVIVTEFVTHDCLLCQGAEEEVKSRCLRTADIEFPVQLERPLMEQNVIRKISVLRRTNHSLRSAVSPYDAVMCGIDSVVARMLIQEACQKGLPTYQVLPSLYLGRVECLRDRVKYWIRRFASFCLGIPYLRIPPGPGQSGFNHIFVMGEKVRQALVKEGIKENSLSAVGVPRFAALFEQGKRCASDRVTDRCCRVLYVTGSYRWHGMDRVAELEENYVRDLVRAARERKEVKISIRLHPRLEENVYVDLRRRDGVKVVESDTDLYGEIVRADVVVANRSTVLYEAVMLNRVAILAMFNGQHDKVLSVLKEDVLTVSAKENLLEVITNLWRSEENYHEILEKEKERAKRVIAPSSVDSAELIGRKIGRDLGIRLEGL